MRKKRRKTKIYCFFHLEEYIQIISLTPEKQKEYDEIHDSEDYEFDNDMYFAERVLTSRGIFTQDPYLTFIITNSISVLNDKGEVLTEL